MALYVKKPKNYKFIIHCLYMSILLSGSIYVSSIIATYYMDESKWIKMAVRFHTLCIFSEFLLIFILILLLPTQRRQPETERYDVETEYEYRHNRFLILAILFAMLWIYLTDGLAISAPRYAYQNLRAGIGPIWAGTIVFSTMYFITKAVQSQKVKFVPYIFFIFIGYISGSKMVAVVAILFPLFLPQVRDKVRFYALPLIAPLSIVAFIVMFDGILTDTGTKLLAYFNLFHLSAMVFEDIADGSMNLHFGTITLSSLWSYVPRAIFEAKPYAYGSAYFVGYYFPGMAEARATPSFGEFTMYFADFWWFGVLISTFRLSVFLRLWAIYQLTTVTKHSWRVPFASGFLLFPTMSFHIPLLLSLIFYWMVSRFTIRLK